jgi:pimeloyl-ACP methyl ester carboxylesterase
MLALPVALCSTIAVADEIQVPVLDWETCPPAAEGMASTDGMLCASAAVPMDYADLAGSTFSLALIKAPARNATDRIGTLFWNPGGPSDSGTAYLPAAIGGFPERVRDRFDIVSWDPRGMGGRTTPVVQCFDSAEAETTFLEANLPDGLPVTLEELARNAEGRAGFSAACIERSGDLLAHVSTADNARDLDLLRQSVGEETLSYYGTSYGTFLGATYVNMFPERVRAAVLDGAISPSAWAGGSGEDVALSTFIRVGSDFGSASTIRVFMDQCGSVETTACAFSAGSPAVTREKWAALLKRAEAGLSLDGQTIDKGDVLTYVGSSIYTVEPVPGFDRFPGWIQVAQFLEELWQGSAAPATAASQPSASAGTFASKTAESAGSYTTSAGRQLSVICGESPNPETADAVSAQIEASYARAGLSPWPLVASCVGWTARAANAYLGPWNNSTPGPVLVIGNTFDPATPLSGSVRLVQELADARLLVVNGFGHTVLINPSTCAQDYIADYLINGLTPPLGATCTQDRTPFPGN